MIPRCSSASRDTTSGRFELIDAANAERDQTAGNRDRAALTEGVHAETGEAGDRVGEVDLPFLGELAQAVVRRQHLAQNALRVGGRKRFRSDSLEIALDAHQWGRRDLEMQVRAIAFHDRTQRLL